MKKNKLFFAFFIVLITSCKKEKAYTPISDQTFVKEKKLELTEFETQNWHLKDIEIDSIPGISLQRAKDSLLTGKKGKEVIVAILDSKIDINHESLKDYIWKNPKEIPNNGIDDDQNGYIDDVHGWNFLGNQKGENTNYTSYEYTRILKKYDHLFKDKKEVDITSKDSLLFNLYTRAKKAYDKRMKYTESQLKYANNLLKYRADLEKGLLKYFPNNQYTKKDLDSLKKIYPDDKELHRYTLIYTNFMKPKYSQKSMELGKLKAQERIDKLLNLSYNERELIGDDLEDINETNYGNNIVDDYLGLFVHATEVSSVITSFKLDNVKIMPIPIFTNGEVTDKDLALAIRYAVDNGASIINMSFSKSLSLHENWLEDAFKYAENHNVLIVTSSGNSYINLNNSETVYPTDYFDNKEISNNFLKIGSTSQKLTKNFVSSYSNYGNKHVDVFAPGENLYVAFPNNKYKYDSGTSLSSATVAGVAALVYSYYPDLTVSQIKDIIINSSVKYNIDVEIKVGKEKTLAPFSSLSKSGGIVNAYNALIMADSISKN
ncbi:peptidase S8 [Polaribacter pacificus]|uniref:Peptidase S8 n=1 Tax=Polaribacter pacificus TaxID=1775173 RepID=A0A917HWV4_9FLAO|nr:S8 family serine peptidase [Polaribacter pacificus]GGG94756.1 peptidase S8 [Polaribacter pacificus]